MWMLVAEPHRYIHESLTPPLQHLRNRLTPRAETVKIVPNARPLCLAVYTSAMTDCTHGMTNARPSPFSAHHAAACTGIMTARQQVICQSISMRISIAALMQIDLCSSRSEPDSTSAE